MKKTTLFFKLMGCAFGLCFWFSAQAADEQKLSPYFDISATLSGSEKEIIPLITDKLIQKKFNILGTYSPMQDSQLTVIVFSRPDIIETLTPLGNRSLLAAALKIGIQFQGGKARVSMLNPQYIYNAYLGDKYDKVSSTLSGVTTDLKSLFIGEWKTFGGEVEQNKLRTYYYMFPAATQTFNKPIEYKKFESFEKGLEKIKKNLAEQKNGLKEVYSIEVNSKKIAVFGVGLLNKEKGESSFLKTIGVDHLAALPYEIILVDNQASILHGKYRIAAFWPSLSMGQFMKISFTPGHIESLMESLCD